MRKNKTRTGPEASTSGSTLPFSVIAQQARSINGTKSKTSTEEIREAKIKCDGNLSQALDTENKVAALDNAATSDRRSLIL